ncbi:MAG: alpha-galactosidase [Chitinophagaceae bacterium]
MNKLLLFFVLFILFNPHPGFAQQGKVDTAVENTGDSQIFSLHNSMVDQRVVIRKGQLGGDELIGKKAWLSKFGGSQDGFFTDGDFALKMMWTGWRAPGKTFNADLRVVFTKKDYRLTSHQFRQGQKGATDLDLFFSPINPENTIQLKITYSLKPGKFYARRKISILDSTQQTNWLEDWLSRKGEIAPVSVQNKNDLTQIRQESSLLYQPVQASSLRQEETSLIVKKGDFGQPCALDFAHGGVFFGIEYPAASNRLTRLTSSSFFLKCREWMGEVVRKNWLSSHWVVEGISPNQNIKDWFFNYLPDIRVAPNRPYALYNSWYDLRSPKYPGIAKDHVMNEKNISHIISLIRLNMVDRYGIHLNAFVLDDGWDQYQSSWKLRKSTFPNGIQPIVNQLKKMGTTLGFWFGPTGGYSFRMRRINWMKAHGYETVGLHSGDAMMDIAGPRYRALFTKRTTDFVRQGVGYFKWDGIQFSSSEPGNGHPVGYHSRRAALESVIAACKAVRAINPKTFLNITSGTWLSPWWMKYANQIWMQGEDYGYADVPSIEEREAAITYRDFVLYDDLHNQDVWFPVSNMMTHGIIKGRLESLGGQDDPLDVFTNDVVMYFGRGVTMYELYISPDLLSSKEWLALSQSLLWAKNRFPILAKTYMTGGDPTQGQPYGYVHFNNDQGILALRNPIMRAQNIRIRLDPAKGLNPEASSLVLERIYPTHWISPDFYAAGSTLILPLDGYETAIYEIFPVKQATQPLVAGVVFQTGSSRGNRDEIKVLGGSQDPSLLNPEQVSSIRVNGKLQPLNRIRVPSEPLAKMVKNVILSFKGSRLSTSFHLNQQNRSARLVVFLRPDSAFLGKAFPGVFLRLDGERILPTHQEQEGLWAVYSISLTPPMGNHQVDLSLKANAQTSSWKGNITVWMVGQVESTGPSLQIKMRSSISHVPMLPNPYQQGALKLNQKLGMGSLSL